MVAGIAAPFVSWVRFAVHVLLFAALARPWHDLSVLKARSLPLQILRGAFLFGSTYFNFKALQTLQLAQTTSIFFFAPMVITALAGPLLGEWAGLAALDGDPVWFRGRAGDHPAGPRRFRDRARLCALGDAQLFLYVIMTRAWSPRRRRKA